MTPANGKVPGRLAALCFVVGFCVFLAVRALAAEPGVWALSTDWRYRFGDDLAWKSPDFDDSGWRYFDQDGGARPEPGLNSARVIWLRTRLETPLPAGSALYLGRIQDADETFLDGERIGGEGAIIERARDYAGSGSAVVSRVYPLKEGARKGAVIAIRAQSFQYSPGPPLGPVMAGDALTLAERARKADLGVWLRDSLWLAVLFVGACISLVSVRGTGRDSRNIWLPWTLGVTAFAALPLTIVGYELGFATPGFVWAAELSPYVFLWFLHLSRSIDRKLTRLQIFLIASYYLLQVWSVATNQKAALFGALYMISAIPICLAGAISAVHVWLARREGRATIWTPLAVIAILSGVLLAALFDEAFPAAFDPLNLGALAAVACMLLAMAEDHRRDRAALRRKTSELLVAQDAERARIAVDLHDGVNQRLAVTRFRLERLAGGANVEPAALSAPVKELREAAHDIAMLVEGLRAAPTAQTSFADSIRLSAERWRVLGDIEIEVAISGEKAPELSDQTQVFRIFQEAVHNARRHAGANRVVVEATLSGTRGRLTIRDDGEGFDTASVSHGVGLAAMRERARIIGADLSIESAVGAGTRIDLEFALT